MLQVMKRAVWLTRQWKHRCTVLQKIEWTIDNCLPVAEKYNATFLIEAPRL